MLAVDSDVLIRLITRDNAAQSRRAARLFQTHEIELSRTVLLETARILAESFGFERERVLDALQAVAGLPGVRVENAREVSRAIELSRAGLDFAEAMHIACNSTRVFVTSDEQLYRRARRAGVYWVKRL